TRRKLDPVDRSGFIRIDTVHQGDQGGTKGLYHTNAADEVVQFEIVTTVERVSEQFLIPALTILLDAFPFQLREFHLTDLHGLQAATAQKKVGDLRQRL